jgi:prevent-host-death family protein
MQTVNIHEAKTNFSRFVDQAEAGEEIVIARAGKPVARLVALVSAAKPLRTLGLGKTQFSFPEHFNHLDAAEISDMFEQSSSK